MYIRLLPRYLPPGEKQKWQIIRYLDWLDKPYADKQMYEVRLPKPLTAAQKQALSLGHIKRHGLCTQQQAQVALKSLRELAKVIDQSHINSVDLNLCLSKMCDAYNSARSAMVHWEIGIKKAKEAKQIKPTSLS